jgi:hypothetical protein
MATISSCGSKGPLHDEPKHADPPLPDTHRGDLRKDKWTTVIDWTGSTDEALVFAITVTGPDRDPHVEWKSFGESDQLVSRGEFQKRIDFTIYPQDKRVKIDIKVDDDNATIDIALRASVNKLLSAHGGP